MLSLLSSAVIPFFFAIVSGLQLVKEDWIKERLLETDKDLMLVSDELHGGFMVDSERSLDKT